jgi:AcrR family transcriptional regulator
MAKSNGQAAVRPNAEERVSRFMKTALAILGETGRTEFTVLEIAERSKTSLRSFYQHFSSKDGLLLALVDKVMTESARQWRADTDGLPGQAALQLLIERVTAPASTSKQDSINRGLTFYNDHLAESLPSEYARVISPLHTLIQDILRRGITEGAFRNGIEAETHSALILQSVLGAMRLRSLGVELNGRPIEGHHIHEFCVRGMLT